MATRYPVPQDFRCPACKALEGRPCTPVGSKSTQPIRSSHHERIVLAANARNAR